MQILFKANARCAAAVADPPGQPITAGSVGIMTVFDLSADFDGLVVTAVFRSAAAKRDVILSAGSDPVPVPWEVLAAPALSLEIGVVGTNGAGTVVIPTVWAKAGRIVPAAQASGISPDDPSVDIGAQIVEQARQAAGDAEAWAGRSEQFAGSSEQKAEEAERSSEDAEAWAVGQRGGIAVGPGDETYQNNAKFYAGVAQQGAEESGFAWFDVDDDTGEMTVTITANLAATVSFAVDENSGQLEVILHE